MKLNFLSVLLILVIIPLNAQKYIADYSVAKEDVLRSIPIEYIRKARTELKVSYQHTSHGTQVYQGLSGLLYYKPGDDTLFAMYPNPKTNKLLFRDNFMYKIAPEGVEAVDLSADETAFIQTTRDYLDLPENAEINVIMWSWCDIADRDVMGNYLPGMDSLISEYGIGGTKIGSGPGQREVPVTFIFMTGHANTNANVGALNPKSQAEVINAHCMANGYYCLDYYSIDTHDMNDNYWEDAGDDGNSAAYGGNFYQDWQDEHVLGEHYFENRESPDGDVRFGQSHNTQHITANRKAYAMWWILARLAGWEDTTYADRPTYSNQFNIYPNPGKGLFNIKSEYPGLFKINVFRMDGSMVYSHLYEGTESGTTIDLSGQSAGMYVFRIQTGSTIEDRKVIILSE